MACANPPGCEGARPYVYTLVHKRWRIASSVQRGQTVRFVVMYGSSLAATSLPSVSVYFSRVGSGPTSPMGPLIDGGVMKRSSLGLLQRFSLDEKIPMDLAIGKELAAFIVKVGTQRPLLELHLLLNVERQNRGA
jgi:hypothetical protein